jgi:two-component system response regulator AtoC
MKDRLVLIVDDEPKMRRVLEIALKNMGHRTVIAENGRDALAIYQRAGADLIITDIRMPQMEGIELLSALRDAGSDVPVIVITAHGAIETAIASLRKGAADYLLRPFDLGVLELAVSRVFKVAELARANNFLRQEVDRGSGAFVGDSEQMRAVFESIRQVGPSKASVLITGETGTGKELTARAVHNASPRRDKLFVPINCAALPADILEAELFGYEKGAFTGALKDRVGKFEYADGGTLFLDELTEMPIALQAKLLRVIQESTVERLGSNRSVELDLRFVAATNQNPREAIRQGRLREDLYYRLNVFAIDLPPLRQRPSDIPDLVAYFIGKHAPTPSSVRVSDEAMERLCSYAWPGNVRELENMVERALITNIDGILSPRHFLFSSDELSSDGATPISSSTSVIPLVAAVEELEQRLIEAALVRSEGNKSKAAALLEISERTLWYKLKKLR